MNRRFHANVLILCTVLFTKCDSQSAYETVRYIEANGYPVETHHAITSDGYILEMHRISHGRNQVYSRDRPSVFLMHGLMAASNSYIALGPEHAIAYNLADEGFDVWMGNARGTRNSRFHITLDPDDSEEKFPFFDFSFEEIGMLDLPAMIDHVLEVTGHHKLHYIGHSQGGTTFLILNSMIPEYNDKISSAHLMAGVGYMQHFPYRPLAILARFTNTIYKTAVRSGIVEVYVSTTEGTDSNNISNVTNAICDTDDIYFSYACEHMQSVGILSEEDTANSSFGMGGAALKQLAHFGQNIRAKKFRRWDYGIFQNIIHYGSLSPPEYDLGLITVNVTMHYTLSDTLLDEKDVYAMAEVMPNTVVRQVGRETFLHADFVAASDVKPLVTDYIVEALKNAELTYTPDRDEGVIGTASIISLGGFIKLIPILSYFLMT